MMLLEIKALLEGVQRLYTKKRTAQGRVLIQRRTEYHTISKIISMLPAIYIII